MPTLPDGTFSFTIPSEDLSKGLRPSKRSPRNTKFLTESYGAVGRDNVLAALDELEADRIDDALLVGIIYPYPQLFVFTNVIIVATRSDIYELVGANLVLGINITPNEGILWSALDAEDYIYMSNTHVAVRRKSSDKLWEVATDLPTASAICDYNKQVIIGAPNVEQ